MTDVTKEAPFLTHDERDRVELQVQQAVSRFVDQPRAAVEEADHVIDDLVGRFTDAVAERRSALRMSWQSVDETADTEQLRLALRDYRELAERLLRI